MVRKKNKFKTATTLKKERDEKRKKDKEKIKKAQKLQKKIQEELKKNGLALSNDTLKF